MIMQTDSKRLVNSRDGVVSPHSGKATERALNYVASTDYGPVGITIIKSGDAGSYISAVESRLELCRIERLLRALEEAIQLPLDPEFVEADLETPLSFIAKIPATLPVTRVAIHLPVGCWRHYDAVTSRFETSAYDVTWPVCQTSLVLAKLSIPVEDLNSLKLNSTVLIPDAYQARWAVNLIFPTMNAQLTGHIELPHMVWTTSSEVEPVPSAKPSGSTSADPEPISGELELEAFSRCSVLTRKCLEGVDSIGYAVNKKLHQCGCVLAGLPHADCAGVLMPIGNGAGLHITHYVEKPPQALQ